MRFFNSFSSRLLSAFSWSSMLMKRYSATSASTRPVLWVDLSREEITAGRVSGDRSLSSHGLELSLLAGQYQTDVVLTSEVVRCIGDHADEPFGQYPTNGAFTRRSRPVRRCLSPRCRRFPEMVVRLRARRSLKHAAGSPPR